MSIKRHTLTSFFPELWQALRRCSLAGLWSSFSLISALLRRPRSCGHILRHQSSDLPYDLLMLSIALSILRIGVDPALIHLLQTLGIPLSLHPAAVLLSMLGSGIGAMLIPMFWHRVLGIAIERDDFVSAMIVMYVVVELPWDLSSLLWMSLMYQQNIPLWLPDTIKTIIMTVYCTVAGAALTQETTPSPVE